MKKKIKSKDKDLILLALLGEENALDVGQNTSLSNGNLAEKLVQLFVIPDGKLEMSGVDSLLLVVTGSVAGQLQDLSSKVLHDCGKVHWSSTSNALSVVAILQETVDTTDGELESSTVGTRLALGTSLATFSTS